jgi:hypothetical protein
MAKPTSTQTMERMVYEEEDCQGSQLKKVETLAPLDA